MSTNTNQGLNNILIATGNPSVAKHYAEVLNSEYGITVLDSLGDALEQINRLAKSLLILDPALINGDSSSTVSDIVAKYGDLRIIIIEDSCDQSIDQHALFKAGAHGFCKSDIAAALLCKAVQLVFEGEYWIQRKLITRVISDMARNANTLVTHPEGPDDSLISTLTPRELQVARMVHLGGNNKMIARELDISERTVKAHLSAIFRKLDIENRLHLALYFSSNRA